jgi:hypothetical protein
VEYTKAEFTAQYGFYPLIPGTNYKLAGLKHKGLFGTDEPVTLRLHYHPLRERISADQRADKIISAKGITAEDSLIIFGGAYGWLGEALITKTGCSAVSIDTSQYVHDTKDQSPDDDLIESIRASGYDETTGIGLQLFNWFSDPTPRASITVLNEDMANGGSRNRIKSALPKKPTRVITEEVWQTLTPAEQTLYQSRIDQFGLELIHVIDGIVI